MLQKVDSLVIQEKWFINFKTFSEPFVVNTAIWLIYKFSSSFWITVFYLTLQQKELLEADLPNISWNMDVFLSLVTPDIVPSSSVKAILTL